MRRSPWTGYLMLLTLFAPALAVAQGTYPEPTRSSGEAGLHWMLLGGAIFAIGLLLITYRLWRFGAYRRRGGS